MVIPNPNELKRNAARALARGREPKKVITFYAAVTTLLSVVLTAVNIWLNHQIDGTGGLANLGTRAVFSTIQTMLPMVQSVVLMCMELGYLYAMLRIARGQYADHTDLKMGFRRFWPLVRMTLLQAFLFFGIGMLVFQLSYTIYMLTPWASPLIELILPIAASGTMVIDDATLALAMEYMIPMMILFAVLYLAVLLPFLFWFRMADYALLDNPRAGAMGALRASRKMMRRNFVGMFKLDLSFWWFYLITALAMLVSYADLLLPLMGVELPFNATVSSLVVYGVYLAILFARDYYLRNGVEVSYIMAYESLREKPADDGVVLGNIFDM